MINKLAMTLLLNHINYNNGMNVSVINIENTTYNLRQSVNIENLTIDYNKANCSNFDTNRGCMYHGFCHDSGICSCDAGYATVNCANNLQCCHTKKKQWVAFLLAWFTSFVGGPFWYANQTTAAITLLVIGLLLCCCTCFSGCFGSDNNNENGKSTLTMICQFINSCWIFVLCIVCLILTGINNINENIDGKEIKMEPW